MAGIDYTALIPNNVRLHESLGDIPPLEYEQQQATQRPTTLAGAMV